MQSIEPDRVGRARPASLWWNNMCRAKWAAVAAGAATILLPALWTATAGIAAVPCPPKPWCMAKAVCVHWGGCGHLGNGCKKWTCRDFNTQTKQPLKLPKPLPGSRLK